MSIEREYMSLVDVEGDGDVDGEGEVEGDDEEREARSDEEREVRSEGTRVSWGETEAGIARRMRTNYIRSTVTMNVGTPRPDQG